MDYPKTVPGVNLHNDKFHDGDQSQGIDPSLDPAAWANAVTDEILNLQEAGNVSADENRLDQVKTAILNLIRGSGNSATKATTALFGVARRATDAKASGGIDNEDYITSKQLADNIPQKATDAQAGAGIDNQTFVTPKQLKNNVPPVFEEGTTMLFVQSAAPVGWTKITTHHNKALRIVNTEGGGGAGSVNFSSAFANKSIDGAIGNATAGGSVSVSNRTLTTSQMPSHGHDIPTRNASGDGSALERAPSSDGTFTTNNVGGGSAHNHTASFTGVAHSHSFSGVDINMAVKYVDAIICQKDAV